MKLFEQTNLGGLTLKNRIIRSATYEGMADENGFPSGKYRILYKELAEKGAGCIITGFAYVSPGGRAMQPFQAGIDDDLKIPSYKKVTGEVHRHGSKIFIQLAHAGRQTLKRAAGGKIKGVSGRKSSYFNEKPEILSEIEIASLINEFARAALRAKKAGFDGIQLHAAHGYLLHQFILPSVNTRKDIFGIDKELKIGTKFLDMVIDGVRNLCGGEFPILVKISASDDYFNKFSKKQFVNLVRFLNAKNVSGIEVSYGTMDCALNIFRGSRIPIEVVLGHNPRFKVNNPFFRRLWSALVLPFLRLKIKSFKPVYNLEFARIAKTYTKAPVISVGGFRNAGDMNRAVEEGSADFVSLCRPFICEPDLVRKIEGGCYESKCRNCNICAVMCDTKNPTRCYGKGAA